MDDEELEANEKNYFCFQKAILIETSCHFQNVIKLKIIVLLFVLPTNSNSNLKFNYSISMFG